ncbi:MAG: hypothetical protein MHM6MM_000028 [Cercozoa sp. M6MM]
MNSDLQQNIMNLQQQFEEVQNDIGVKAFPLMKDMHNCMARCYDASSMEQAEACQADCTQRVAALQQDVQSGMQRVQQQVSMCFEQCNLGASSTGEVDEAALSQCASSCCQQGHGLLFQFRDSIVSRHF